MKTCSIVYAHLNMGAYVSNMRVPFNKYNTQTSQLQYLFAQILHQNIRYSEFEKHLDISLNIISNKNRNRNAITRHYFEFLKPTNPSRQLKEILVYDVRMETIMASIGLIVLLRIHTYHTPYPGLSADCVWHFRRIMSPFVCFMLS